jgi:hypothetical protein
MANNKSCLSCTHCKDERGEFSTLLSRWCALNYYPLQAGGLGGCRAHLTKHAPDAVESARKNVSVSGKRSTASRRK